MNVALQSSPLEKDAAARAPGRALALDALRLLAIFQMVQGHTIDAVLAAAHRSGALHDLWQSARGLTSVAFLFLAGAGFAFATRSERGRTSEARARRSRRGLMLIGLGYLLRAPVALLFGAGEARRAELLARAAIVDVLQCIGVTLLVLDALLWLVPKDRMRAVVFGALGALLLALGPLATRVDPGGALRPLLAYATSNGGSLFPLAPWAGHALLGAALGPLFFARDARRLFGAGVLFVALGAVLLRVHPALGQLARIGCVVLVSAALVALEPHLQRLPRWLLQLAPHSLLIYLVHVVLAYGEGFGLMAVVGRTLGPLSAIGVAGGMLALCALLALGYDAAEKKGGLAARAAPG